jgi:GTPase SAR1 family protein
VKAQIWDIAGQERFIAITSHYYHQAHGAIVVYDITSESSFRQLKQWLKRLEQHSGNLNLVVLLVGNKGDMEYNRVISINEAKNFAEENELLFMETSAKENMNVELAFRTILKDLIEIQSNTDLLKQFLPINLEPPSPISEQTPFRLQNMKQGKKERKIFGFIKY